MIRFIDTHTHLCDESFAGDLADVIARARHAGGERIVTVSETLADARRNLELAREHPVLLPAAGLYPTWLDMGAAEQMAAWITRHRDGLAAIGEVGLDFWAVKDESGRSLQRQIFEIFIDLSLELALPLNVHSRSAGRHAVDLLIEKNAKRVQLHAFDGKWGAAQPAAAAGYFFSVPPSIVRSRQKTKLVGNLPLSSLLVETDSPVLGPEPGERNEPFNALVSLEAIARIKKISAAEAAEAVYDNTRRLYDHRLATG